MNLVILSITVAYLAIILKNNFMFLNIVLKYVIKKIS